MVRRVVKARPDDLRYELRRGFKKRRTTPRLPAKGFEREEVNLQNIAPCKSAEDLEVYNA